MIASLFNTAVYTPLYNALIGLLDIIPGADVGIAVILLTIAVKLVLYPFARAAIKTQLTFKRIKPELDALKEKHSEDPQEHMKAMMSLQKEHGVNPLSSIVTIFVQLPIILGLYWVFFYGGLPEVNLDLLYSFIPVPDVVNMQFLGIVDMGGRSIILAFLAGFTQFIHARIAIEPPDTKKAPGESFQEDLMRSLHIQMRYMLPVLIAVFAYFISSAVALYWVTSNIFTIAQELHLRRKFADQNKK